MQSRLLRLTGMTMDVPPRPLSQAEEERLAEALRYGETTEGTIDTRRWSTTRGGD